MADTLLAIFLVCSVQSTTLEPQCVILEDTRGPAGSVEACRERLDRMWTYLENNSNFIINIAEKIGEFKISQEAHKGYCINPSSDWDNEINRYTF